jgi:methionine-rich copper-binding protein CopC
MSKRWIRALGLTTLAAMLTVAGVGLVAAPAQAHNYLVSSTPAAGSVLTELPDQFSVTTNDVLLDFGGDGSTAALEVKGPDGSYYGNGCVTVSGASIATDAALGTPGTYTVLWRVISTDGHPVSNEFTFTWQPAAPTQPSTGSATPPVCGSSSAAALTPEQAQKNADEAARAASAEPGATGQASQSLPVVVWVVGAVVVVAFAVFVTLWLLRKPAVASSAGGDTAAADDDDDAAGAADDNDNDNDNDRGTR